MLLRLEPFRSGNDAVKLLDPGREPLCVTELVLDVALQGLPNLLGADAVEVRRRGDVAHHRLDLHPVRLLEQLENLLPPLCVRFREDPDLYRFGAHEPSSSAQLVRLTVPRLTGCPP